jgi:outer membrane usher protein
MSAGGDAREAILSATVNGVADPTPLMLLTDGPGRVYASAEQLQAWRLSDRGLPSITHDGKRYYLLNAISGAQVHVEESTQELNLKVPASALAPTRLSYAPVEISDEVVDGTGAFVNYDASIQQSDGQLSGAGAVELGLFTPYGVGLSRFVARTGGVGQGVVRLETNWTIDDPERMRSLRFGDSVSRGGSGGRPVRFAGIQFARNFAVQPGFVTFPVPSLEGSADVPSIVDVYVNDVLTKSSDVPPGPFDITDIPVVTGSGDVQLIVRDMLGRQQLISQSYYASSTMLRRGLDDYSYELGFLRRAFGTRSNAYGSPFVSATHRYGFTDRFTGEAHIEATPHVQLAGLGANVAVPDVGELSGAVSTSRSDKGQGYSASFTFERRSRGLTLGIHSELASKNFNTVGASPDRRPPASIIQAFAGIPVGNSSLAISYFRRDGRSEPDAQVASASWSARLGRIGSLNLSARTSLSGPRESSAELLLIVPLGSSRSASAGARFDRGRAGFETSFQKSVPLGSGLGYRFNASAGRFERADGRVTIRTAFADYDAQLTWVDGKTGVRLSTAGAVGLLGNTLFASRKLEQSFARVDVGDYGGVKVYADNQLIGRTGSDGSLIVPNLRPYDRNRIRIDTTDLPLDAEIGEDQKLVRPHDRTGVSVEFAAKPSRSAYLRVVLADGSPLPAGSSVRVAGRPDAFVSAPGGEVYLTGIEARTAATAEWAGGRCTFEVEPTEGQSAAPTKQVNCGAVG